MKRLENKVAIVTGATSGIGKAIAIEYAKQGAKVVVVGRNEERGNADVETIKNNGGEAVFCQADMKVEADISNMVNVAIAEYGKLDILVSNAGTSISMPFEQATVEAWNEILATNTTAIFHGIHKALPHLLETKGSIITVASTGAIAPLPCHHMYCASKAAARMLTKAIALDYAGQGVRANVICPGVVHTPLLGTASQEIIDATAATIPLKRLGEPEDLAHMAVYLGSDESAWVTGQTFAVDGGMTNH